LKYYCEVFGLAEELWTGKNCLVIILTSVALY
jgi:hypothetical protein